LSGILEYLDVIVRRLQDSDLEEADKLLRLCFGTFMGIADPMTCFGDTDYVKTRFHGDPDLTIAAEANGRLVGVNFITNWGSVGFFGPLCIHPEFWNKGMANNFLVQRWICSKNEYNICWAAYVCPLRIKCNPSDFNHISNIYRMGDHTFHILDLSRFDLKLFHKDSDSDLKSLISCSIL
jgi:hypothetical protein